MIIKFDHITYVSQRRQFMLPEQESEKVLFREKALKNPKGLLMFMEKPQYDSDVIFVNKEIPTEYVQYDSVDKQTEIKVIGNTIYARALSKKVDLIDEILVRAVGVQRIRKSIGR